VLLLGGPSIVAAQPGIAARHGSGVCTRTLMNEESASAFEVGNLRPSACRASLRALCTLQIGCIDVHTMVPVHVHVPAFLLCPPKTATPGIAVR